MRERMYSRGAGINEDDGRVHSLMMTFRVPCDECESDGFNIVLHDDRVVCEGCFEMLLRYTKTRMKRRIEM